MFALYACTLIEMWQRLLILNISLDSGVLGKAVRNNGRWTVVVSSVGDRRVVYICLSLKMSNQAPRGHQLCPLRRCYREDGGLRLLLMIRLSNKRCKGQLVVFKVSLHCLEICYAHVVTCLVLRNPKLCLATPCSFFCKCIRLVSDVHTTGSGLPDLPDAPSSGGAD